MDKTTSILPEMHHLHHQLESVRKKLSSGPRKVTIQKRILKEKQEEHAALKVKLIDLRKSADSKTLQLKSNEAKIQDLEGKRNAASSNKEYQIISSQIEADTMANSVLEDEILEALEKVDLAEQQIAEANESITAQEAQIQVTEQEVNASKEGLEEEASTHETALSELETGLPVPMMDQYRRLVIAHGAACLTEVENDACTSCYAIIAPQERVHLNVGKIMFCRSCGRIMYLQQS